MGFKVICHLILTIIFGRMDEQLTSYFNVIHAECSEHGNIKYAWIVTTEGAVIGPNACQLSVKFEAICQ